MPSKKRLKWGIMGEERVSQLITLPKRHVNDYKNDDCTQASTAPSRCASPGYYGFKKRIHDFDFSILLRSTPF